MNPDSIFPRLIEQRASEYPNRVLLESVEEGPLTYAELRDGGREWAAAYAAVGVGAGDNVVVIAPVTLDYYRSWLGLTLLRAVDVSVNTEYRGDMLVHVLTNSQADVVVVAPAFLNRLLAVLPKIQPLARIIVLGEEPFQEPNVLSQAAFLAQASADFVPKEVPQAWDTSAIIYTSGTTGPSKGVVLPWAHLHRQSRNFIPIDDCNADDAFYSPVVSYHLGSKVLPYLAALINGRFVFRERFSAAEFWDDIQRHGCTTTAMVGAMIPWVSAAARPEHAQTPLRNVVMAPAPPDVDAFKERFGVRVATAYSMTEISNPIASLGWDVANDNHASCGRLKPGFEVRIVDEHDEEVAQGEVGELIVRADEPWALNQGYFGMPEASLSSWRNGWFHTGDTFRVDNHGRYYFLDRLKDAIRRRGENISSFEVEGHVNQHPEVVESAAIAVPSEHTEDEVMVVVRRIDNAQLTADELLAWLEPRMPRFMLPRYVEFTSALPKTPTDRLQKVILRARGVTEATWDREKRLLE